MMLLFCVLLPCLRAPGGGCLGSRRALPCLCFLFRRDPIAAREAVTCSFHLCHLQNGRRPHSRVLYRFCSSIQKGRFAMAFCLSLLLFFFSLSLSLSPLSLFLSFFLSLFLSFSLSLFLSFSLSLFFSFSLSLFFSFFLSLFLSFSLSLFFSFSLSLFLSFSLSLSFHGLAHPVAKYFFLVGFFVLNLKSGARARGPNQEKFEINYPTLFFPLFVRREVLGRITSRTLLFFVFFCNRFD